MSKVPALDAAIELMDDILHPEGLGHALPQEARTRAYVVRQMIERLRQREIVRLEKKCQED